MSGIAFTSYKHEWDRELLDIFSEAVYALKLQAQDKLDAHDINLHTLHKSRTDLDALLDKLAARVQSLASNSSTFAVRRSQGSAPFSQQHNGSEDSIPFTGLADRFVNINTNDVEDRLDEIQRLRTRLADSDTPLLARDFRLLDQLQTLIEEEAAEGIQGLYSL